MDDDAFASEFDVGEPEPEEVAPPTSRSALAVETLVNELGSDEPSGESEPTYDYMTAVDERLEVASYYRELLRAPLFNVATPAALIVEREHRGFIRERLEVLLSLRPETVHAPLPLFSDEEVDGLKVLIAQMRRKGMLDATAPPPAKPSIPSPVPPPVRQLRPQPVRRAPAHAPPPAAPIVARTSPATARIAAPPAPVPVKPPRPTAKAATVKRTVVHPTTGKEVDVTVARIHRPSGALPFPTDMAQATHLSAITSVHANSQGKIGPATVGAIAATAMKE